MFFLRENQHYLKQIGIDDDVFAYQILPYLDDETKNNIACAGKVFSKFFQNVIVSKFPLPPLSEEFEFFIKRKIYIDSSFDSEVMEKLRISFLSQAFVMMRSFFYSLSYESKIEARKKKVKEFCEGKFCKILSYSENHDPLFFRILRLSLIAGDLSIEDGCLDSNWLRDNGKTRKYFSPVVNFLQAIFCCVDVNDLPLRIYNNLSDKKVFWDVHAIESILFNYSREAYGFLYVSSAFIPQRLEEKILHVLLSKISASNVNEIERINWINCCALVMPRFFSLKKKRKILKKLKALFQCKQDDLRVAAVAASGRIVISSPLDIDMFWHTLRGCLLNNLDFDDSELMVKTAKDMLLVLNFDSEREVILNNLYGLFLKNDSSLDKIRAALIFGEILAALSEVKKINKWRDILKKKFFSESESDAVRYLQSCAMLSIIDAKSMAGQKCSRVKYGEELYVDENLEVKKTEFLEEKMRFEFYNSNKPILFWAAIKSCQFIAPALICGAKKMACLQFLQGFFKSDEPVLCSAALKAFGVIVLTCDAGVDGIYEIFKKTEHDFLEKHQAWYVRAAFVELLGAVISKLNLDKDRDAFGELKSIFCGFLRDDNWRVRKAAIDSLTLFACQNLLFPLCENLLGDAVFKVRESVVKLLRLNMLQRERVSFFAKTNLHLHEVREFPRECLDFMSGSCCTM